MIRPKQETMFPSWESTVIHLYRGSPRRNPIFHTGVSTMEALYHYFYWIQRAVPELFYGEHDLLPRLVTYLASFIYFRFAHTLEFTGIHLGHRKRQIVVLITF